MSNKQKPIALDKIVTVLGIKSAQVAYYGSALGAIVLAGGGQLTPELAFVAGSIGANVLSSLIEDIAKGQSIPEDEIINRAEDAIQSSEIANLLTKKDFLQGYARLLQRLDDQKEISEHILTELRSGFDKVATADQVQQLEQLIEERLPSQTNIYDIDWFKKQVEKSIADAEASRRYIPALNVELPIKESLDAVGRTSEFYTRIYALHKNIRKKYQYILSESSHNEVEKEIQPVRESSESLLKELDGIDASSDEPITFPKIHKLCEILIDVTQNAQHNLELLAEKIVREESKDDSSKHEKSSNWLQNRSYHIRQLQSAIYALRTFVNSKDAKLANHPYALLSGEGGIGKTHFLCEIAKRRIDAGLPTLLFLGEKFGVDEPWQQIMRQLRLSDSRDIDENLDELDNYAGKQNTRLLIIIDALNEGPGTIIWQRDLGGFLHVAEQYTHIGIAVSVRSEYKDYIIPEELIDTGKLIEIEHRGFTGLIDQAVRIYFAHYGIEYRFPPLQREFQNPLFLQTLCRGLQNDGLNHIPAGLHGFTQILQFFIDSVNKRLAKKLQYNPRRNLVRLSINALVAHMASTESIFLSETDAEKIVNDFLPNNANKYIESLYYHLLAEGVIVTTIRDGVDSVRFLYDRFTDHLIVQHLLDLNLDPTKSIESFDQKQPLGKILTHKTKFRFRYSLIPAFAIQIPEMIELELFEVAPYMMDDIDDLIKATITSLIWRKWGAEQISLSLIEFINNHILTHEHYSDGFFEAILGVTANPNHPFNADFLHNNLIGLDMADRDAWWSIFLHENYYDEEEGEQTSIARLINWAWSDIDKTSFDSESIRLMGTALAWFLSTSNRFLRDKATKAFVTLFENQLPILMTIIKDFSEIDDLYISERLYAVAYGCAMRSQSCDQVKLLAKGVYELVFEKGSPPPHILLRDYARGVIEVASYKCNNIDIPLEKVRPPYSSQWVGEPPTSEELKENYGTYPDNMTPEDRSIRTIHHSVMGWDFGQYVVSTVKKWTNIPLTDKIPMSPIMHHNQFFDELTDHQKELWEDYETADETIQKVVRYIVERITKSLEDDAELDFESDLFKQRFDEELNKSVYSQDDLDDDPDQKLQSFFSTLDPQQVLTFDNYVKPYLDENYIPGEQLPDFELEFAKRWIVNRVFELGWTIEKFGRFDSYINYHDSGRDAKKVERIGKKYQWLAYHELLARIADNFHYKSDSLGYTVEPYEGTWHNFIRDIDPSFTYKITQHNSEIQNWWFTVDYINWSDHKEHSWVKFEENLPNPKPLISVINPTDNKQWLSLDAMFDWHEPISPIEDKYERPSKRLWYILKSYLIKKEDKKRFLQWAQKQDFMGRWMPESHDVYEVFLGEFFWTTAYRYHRNLKVGHHDWENSQRDGMPNKVSVTIDSYAHEDNYDCSIEETIRLKTPSKLLVEMMELSWQGKEGFYYDKDGKLVCFDPSIVEAGPSTLLFDKEYLLEFLDKNELEIIWTLLGEKAVIGGGITTLKEWMKISGVYSFDADEITGGYSTNYEAQPQK